MNYPIYPFEALICKNGNKTYWAAKSKALNGCVGQGNTAMEAINEMAENEREWLKSAGEAGIPIPDVPFLSFDEAELDNGSLDKSATSVSFGAISTKSQLPLVYKSITTVMQFDAENKILYGKLDNVPGEIYYYGNDVDEAEKAFRQKVDEYYDGI